MSERKVIRLGAIQFLNCQESGYFRAWSTRETHWVMLSICSSATSCGARGPLLLARREITENDIVHKSLCSVRETIKGIIYVSLKFLLVLILINRPRRNWERIKLLDQQFDRVNCCDHYCTNWKINRILNFTRCDDGTACFFYAAFCVTYLLLLVASPITF